MLRCLIFCSLSTWTWCYATWCSLACHHEFDATWSINLMPHHLIFRSISTWIWCCAAWSLLAFQYECGATLLDLLLHDAPLLDLLLCLNMNLMLCCMTCSSMSTWTWYELGAALLDLHLQFNMNLMLRSMSCSCIWTWTWCYAIWFSFAFRRVMLRRLICQLDMAGMMGVMKALAARARPIHQSVMEPLLGRCQGCTDYRINSSQTRKRPHGISPGLLLVGTDSATPCLGFSSMKGLLAQELSGQISTWLPHWTAWKVAIAPSSG